jgi:hypothetical protein
MNRGRLPPGAAPAAAAQQVGLVLGLSRRSADDIGAIAMAARTLRSGRTYLAQWLAALADRPHVPRSVAGCSRRHVVRADVDSRRSSLVAHPTTAASPQQSPWRTSVSLCSRTPRRTRAEPRGNGVQRFGVAGEPAATPSPLQVACPVHSRVDFFRAESPVIKGSLRDLDLACCQHTPTTARAWLGRRRAGSHRALSVAVASMRGAATLGSFF